ncbi:serine/threonine-protein phosphatase [Streptomyces sp. PTM05]|uniref:Serine/threonine-protein phosphatase n=1 Tax=Streptantibioticus parmotrematis TaxID=2873249 RepID=A0ABS7R0H6_9ACTN|nr:PP2C family protein-serine/threonine phosphatase [Streptantibioticus parmotrematis]MBY8888969.1 serine/threonine-protein phosphatase [Streptantibioticus parmotrematis]
MVRWRRRLVGAERLPVLVRYGHRSWWVPAALCVVIVGADAATPHSFAAASWLVLVPAVAGGLCGPVATSVFAVVVIGAYPLLDGRWGPSQGLGVFFLVVAGSALAVPLSVLRARAARYVERLRGAAETTRQVVLRPVPAGWGGVDSAARYLAADVEARVGGDFYDVLATPYGARVILGDVQGKGLPAVSVAAALVGSFREAAFHEEDLMTVASWLEERLHRQNTLSTRLGATEERFATAVVIGFPHDVPGEIAVVNFGHDGPHVMGRGGVRQLPAGQGSPIGLGHLTGGLPPVQRVPLGPDDTVLIVSDGVTEARDRAGTFFPLRARLDELAGRSDESAAITPERVVDDITTAVMRHTGGRRSDDCALLAVRRP